jgi:hypothetical protein
MAFFETPATPEPMIPMRQRPPQFVSNFSFLMGADVVGAYRLLRGLSLTTMASVSRNVVGGDRRLGITGVVGLRWELPQ